MGNWMQIERHPLRRHLAVASDQFESNCHDDDIHGDRTRSNEGSRDAIQIITADTADSRPQTAPQAAEKKEKRLFFYIFQL